MKTFLRNCLGRTIGFLTLLLVHVTSMAQPPGNALHFDGSNDNVSINNTLGNFGTGSFTVEAWIRTSAVNGTIISKRNANTNGNFFRFTVISGKVALEIDESSTANYTAILSDATLNDGRWHHVAGVKGATQLFLYVDGLQAATPVTINGNPNISNSVTTSIGQFLNGTTPWDLYAGSMDEFRVYSAALSQANVQADMFSTTASVPGSLLVYYNFDNGTAGGTNTGLTTLTNQAGAGNNGTLNNFALATGNTSNWVESYAMVIPTTTAATNASSGGFTANWTAPAIGTVDNGYRLDVSTNSNFSSFVTGYNGLTVSGTSQAVSGLLPNTTYYYRVRADKTSVTGQGGNSATITAATAALTPPGNALNFDGSSDYVALNTAGAAAINFTSASSFTIETWLNASGTGLVPIFGHKTSSSNVDGYALFLNNGKPYLEAKNNGFEANTKVDAGVWNHVALVYSAGTATWYVNGLAAGSSAVTITAAAQGAYIGSLTSLNYFFPGSMDEFRVWNTARTVTEIRANMFSAISGNPSGLLLYYDFDAGIAGGTNTGLTTSTDKSGNNYTGSLTSFNLTGSSSNWVESYAMAVPTATAATNASSAGFTANWTAPLTGTVDNGYRLDVSTSNTFSSFVTGYNGLTVSGTSQAVSGLLPNTTYYYRVRADKTSITAQGGNSSTITAATLPVSTDATLAALSTTAGTFTPVFSSATTGYAATVTYNTSSVTVTPTVNESHATVQAEINSGGYAPVTSGSPSAVLNLNPGTNTIHIKVTAEDGVTTKTYTLTINRMYVGNALHFDGSNDNVSINNTLGNFGTGSFTIEAWVRTSAVSGNIIGKRNANTNGNFFRLNVTSGKAAMEIDESSAANYTAIIADATLNDGRWHHVAGVRTATQLFLYVDGQQAATPVTINGNPNINNSVVTTIGQFLNGTTPWDFFTGGIDELRVYSTALSQANIQADMFSTTASVPPSLLAYYNFDNGTAGGSNAGLVLLTDQTGNGNNGTLNNFALATGNTSNWVESYAMVIPTAAAPTSLSSAGFTANWTVPTMGLVDNGYRLDVSTNSSFSSFVTGYNGLTVSGTAQAVTGLAPNTTYYYRVRADKTSVTGQGGNSATITAATAALTPPGNALNFDGSDYVALNTAGVAAVNFTTASSFTIETWLNTSGTGLVSIFGHKTSSSNVDGYALFLNNGKPYLEAKNSGLEAITKVAPNAWNHVALVYSAGTATWYVNGLAAGSGAVTITAAAQGAYIGALTNLNYYLSGSMDEFRIWSTARTQAEIQANMFTALSGNPSGLLLYHDFDAGIAGGTNTGLTTLADKSGNNYTGTLTGFNLTGGTSNWISSTIWNRWTGTTSADYTTASNWHLGTVPTAADNIIIPTGASNLPITITTAQAFLNAQVQSGTAITNTSTLSIAGNLFNSGTITSTAGTVAYTGSAAQSITAGSFAGNTVQGLTINNTAGVTLNGALSVTSVVTPTAGTLTTGGYLTLASSATGTARIAQGTGTYISGTVTQQRYIPAKASRTWSLVASPFTQTISSAWQQQVHITGAGTGGTVCPTLTAHTNGFDATVNNAASMYIYDGTKAVNTRWTSVTGTNINLTTGTGYRMNIRGPRSSGCALLDGTVLTTAAVTLSSTGTLSNASNNMGSFTLSYSNNGDATVANDNYLLIGNPYPSEISFSQLRADNSTKISNSYAIYAPGNTVGNYAFWNGSTWTGGNNGLSDATGNIIANGQAFFVQSSIAGGPITNLAFNEAQKTSMANNGYFRNRSNPNRLRIGYMLANGSKADEIMVAFVDKASNMALTDGDIISINTGTQNLKSVKAGRELAFHTRNLDFLTDTVQLQVASSSNGNFSLSFYDFEAFVDATHASIYLLDKYTGTAQLMNGNKEYSFTVNTAVPNSYGKDRFAVVFNRPAPATLSPIAQIKAYPNPVVNQLTVELPAQGNSAYSIKLTDITGRTVLEQKVKSTTRIKTASLIAGTYLLEITNAAGGKQVQRIVKQ